MKNLLVNFLNLYQDKNLLDPIVRQRYFHEFMFSIKIKSYMSKLIAHFSYDLEKKLRNIDDNEIFIGDDSLLNHHIENISFEEDIYDLLACDNWKTTLDKLSTPSKKILKLKYTKNLSNNDISIILNTSPQNVSNIHLRTLKYLRSHLKGCYL
ncbi:hypothetical protein CW674_11605 [Macrococcoides caseolyticum]|uniref:sigma-70 family RNA polymerase sigma factor n=1 Tax=Macrococcoides caseolyticum TaxID=69966 RepID=UPI000C325655|nr:sigma-70 family RNA polymerase sigma factor [Macrococcus caseolyticus]PKE64523.1 hypothetical protein CW674_11605 [Macrococcus caseolyticus]